MASFSADTYEANGRGACLPKFYGLYVSDFLKMLDKALSRGDRVEIIPAKDGIKIMHIKRNELKM